MGSSADLDKAWEPWTDTSRVDPDGSPCLHLMFLAWMLDSCKSRGPSDHRAGRPAGPDPTSSVVDALPGTPVTPAGDPAGTAAGVLANRRGPLSEDRLSFMAGAN